MNASQSYVDKINSVGRSSYYEKLSRADNLFGRTDRFDALEDSIVRIISRKHVCMNLL